MKKKELIIIIAILFIGLLLRVYGYNDFPIFSDTADELVYSWQGYTWINNGTPTSWSNLEAYTNNSITKNITIGEDSYRLVTPWIDHPSLFSLIQGIIIHPYEMLDLNNKIIRIFPLMLFILTFYLIYLLIKDKEIWLRITALSIYSFSASIIFLNRLAVTENLLTPLLLAVLLYVKKYDEHKNEKFLILSIIFAGLAMLTKEVGVFSFLFIGLYLLFFKEKRFKIDYKLFTKLFIGFFITLVIILSYAFLVNMKLFLATKVEMQLLFPFDITSIFDLLIYSKIISKSFIEPIFIIGWIAFFMRKFDIYNLMLITYISSLALTSGGIVFGWYLIPIYPFFIIFIAEVLYSKKKEIKNIFSIILNLPLFRFLGTGLEKSSVMWLLRIAFIFFISSLLILREKPSFQKYFIGLMFLVYFIINISIVLLQEITYQRIYL